MDYFRRANELYSLKEYEKAISMYEKSLEINKNEASSLYNVAVCYIKLKKYMLAIESLNKALKIRSDSKYYFNLAYCYAMTNNKQKSLLYFNLAWALDNSDIECEKAINLILKGYRK